MQLPLISQYARLDEDETEGIGKALREQYEEGRSIRELSEQTSYSIGRVRTLLNAAGTPFRPRGGSR